MSNFLQFLEKPTWEVAPRLLGSLIVRTVEGKQIIGRIVETEAYDQTDAASHSYKGRTPRCEVMFGPAGRAYVYFTYGMHFCFNIVTGPEGYGSAVLVRALEPVQGIDLMRKFRGLHDQMQLVSGPAKLCQAMLIDKKLNGHDLSLSPLNLKIEKILPAKDIVRTTRIGISRERDKAWRFYIRGNQYISKP